MFSDMSKNTTNLYQVLDIDKSASQEDIKKAFKRCALKYHPDKNKDNPKAEEDFKKIASAYNILSDPVKRERYDKFGVVDDDAIGGVSGHEVNINDILRNVFGNMAPFSMDDGGGMSFMFDFINSASVRGAQSFNQHDVDFVELPISLTELYHGTTKNVEVELMDVCHECKGTGAADPSDVIKCIQCSGAGFIARQMGPFMQAQIKCNSCNGKGKIIKNNKHCNHCKGECYKFYKKSFDIKVPKGIPPKFTHVLEGKGGYNPVNQKYKKLTLIFTYHTPKNIKIDNENNVILTLDIRLEELLAGFTTKLNLYGEEFTIISQGYFNPTKVVHIPDLGIPFYKRPGNSALIIKFNISFPEDDKLVKYADVFGKVFKRAKPNTPDQNNTGKTVFLHQYL